MDFDVVYDLVYSPENTRLLDLAGSQGLETISGMEMFVEQAALQSETWTGLSPDREMMRELIRENSDQLTESFRTWTQLSKRS
jgi:shikimate 5-dehydrogenase